MDKDKNAEEMAQRETRNFELNVLKGRVLYSEQKIEDVEIQEFDHTLLNVFGNAWDRFKSPGLKTILEQDWESFVSKIKPGIRSMKKVAFDFYFHSVDHYFEIVFYPLEREQVEILFIDKHQAQMSHENTVWKNRLYEAIIAVNRKIRHSGDVFATVRFIEEVFEKKLRYSFSKVTLNEELMPERRKGRQAENDFTPNDEQFVLSEEYDCLAKMKSWKRLRIIRNLPDSCSECQGGVCDKMPGFMYPIICQNHFYGVLYLGTFSYNPYITEEQDLIGEMLDNLGEYLHTSFTSNLQKEEKLKSYYAELKEQNDQLEKVNRELQRLNIEYRQARIKAEESDRLKSSFLANMSHEIRTPLNGIIGFAQLLKKTSESPQAATYAGMVTDSSNQLLKVINNIIFYSKIQADQVALCQVECSLNEELDKVFFEHLGMVQDDKKNAIDTHRSYALPKGVDKVSLDIVNLKQILGNLLDNAFKFTHQGKVELSYKLYSGKILFCIRDTGIGIQEEKRKIIFERFRQLDESKTRKYGGLGLGLSIVRDLVNMINGEIGMESEPNKGTVFHVTVPFAISESNREIETFLQENQPLHSIPQKRKMVLIEDDPSSSRLIQDSLADYFNIRVFNKGNKALDYLLKSGPIHLIMLDIRLPDMDSQKFISQVKRMHPDLPIIAQTAAYMRKDKVKIIQNGCDELINKPAHAEELIQVVDKYI